MLFVLLKRGDTCSTESYLCFLFEFCRLDTCFLVWLAVWIGLYYALIVFGLYILLIGPFND